ncbi:MAG: LysM peptidoglycan-binding domain-containing protein [Bacteroidales bacterium]|nr:LysM peptidoglycan-binding domain-containing protein [Bacteroidales bacterium]
MKFRALFILWSCIFCLAANNCCVSSGSDAFANELKSMEKAIPLPYNDALDKIVKQLDGKSLPITFTKYEAFIDTALAQRGMPSELRYLPYALSWMKANYSYGDRCGYWALPSLVGMRYGLAIDESRDERWSVEASTLVALDYLNDLHEKYNDWWHSILAYANSPTSLSHALIHHGSEPELWDFYEQDLMPDTRVIADFIACVYLGNQGKLNFSTKDMEPSVDKPKKVSVPEPVEGPATKAPEPVEGPNKRNISEPKKDSLTNSGANKSPETVKYKIKKGDTLTKIANKYHVSVADLKKWNNLKNDNIREGQTLTIKK